MGVITVSFETFVIAYISMYTLTVCMYVVILSISTVYVCNNHVVIPFGLFSLCTLISFSLFNVYTCTCMWISDSYIKLTYIPCFNRKQIVLIKINVYWPLFLSSLSSLFFLFLPFPLSFSPFFLLLSISLLSVLHSWLKWLYSSHSTFIMGSWSSSLRDPITFAW